MANPSTTGGTGAGTEVIRRKFVKNGDFSTAVKILDGEANHLYTIVTIIVCNASTTDAEAITMYVDPAANSSDVTTLLKQQDLPAKSTFVFSDRFALDATDELLLISSSSSSLGVWVTYIDQTYS